MLGVQLGVDDAREHAAGRRRARAAARDGLVDRGARVVGVGRVASSLNKNRLRP